jgi:hypothetical protein
MVKRIASSALWFLAVAWGWNYVALLTDLPSALGPVLAGFMATYICLDPLHRVWQISDLSPRMLPGRTERTS